MKDEPQIDQFLQKAMQISKQRSQEVLREKGRILNFDDLLAAIYFQAYMDISNNKVKS